MLRNYFSLSCLSLVATRFSLERIKHHNITFNIIFVCSLGSQLAHGSDFDKQELIVIVNFKLLKYHSKAKRRAPAYSRALRQIRGIFQRIVRGEAQVRLPEGERMRQIRGVFQRIVRGKLRSGSQKVRGELEIGLIKVKLKN